MTRTRTGASGSCPSSCPRCCLVPYASNGGLWSHSVYLWLRQLDYSECVGATWPTCCSLRLTARCERHWASTDNLADLKAMFRLVFTRLALLCGEYVYGASSTERAVLDHDGQSNLLRNSLSFVSVSRTLRETLLLRLAIICSGAHLCPSCLRNAAQSLYNYLLLSIPGSQHHPRQQRVGTMFKTTYTHESGPIGRNVVCPGQSQG